MPSKLIGGQALVSHISRNGFMRLDVPAKSLTIPLNNNATTTARQDTTGIMISPDAIYGLISSTASPFLRVFNAVLGDWVTPLSSTPTSQANDIVFNAAGTEFFCANNATPFHSRYSYPGFVLQSNFLTLPTGIAIAACYGNSDTNIALAMGVAPWIRVYDLATLDPVSFTPAANAPASTPTDIALNSAGSILAQTNTTGTQGIRVWSYPSGAVLLYDTTVAAHKVKFSPDGTKMAVLNSFGTRFVRIYNTTTWEFVNCSSINQPFNAAGTPRSLHWLGDTHVWVSTEAAVVIYDATTGFLVASMELGAVASVGESVPSPLTKVRKIDGNVKNSSLVNVSRNVRAYNTETGRVAGEAVSDATTGNYTMTLLTDEAVTVVAVGDSGENAKVFNPVYPVVIPPVTSGTLNPADKHSDIVLSNANRTAMKINTGWRAVRSTTSRTTGKHYFEVGIDNTSGTTSAGIGLATANLANYPGSDTLGLGVFTDGNLYQNGVSSALVGTTLVTSDVMCFAFDLDSRKLWVRKNGGAWNGALAGVQNPATGEGGVTLQAGINIALGVFAMVGIQSTTDISTARFASLGFTYVRPVGYNALN